MPNRTPALFLAGLLVLVAAAARAEDPSDGLKADLEKLTGGSFRVVNAGITYVVSDAQEEVAAEVARYLHQVLPRMRALAQMPPDAPVPDRITIALFARRADLDKYLKARKAGNYGRYAYLHDDDPRRRVVAAEVLDARPMLARLRHCAAEALLRAWIPNPPVWLLAGLGEAMEDVGMSDDEKMAFTAPRGHLRDLRERVFQAEPSPLIPLQDLIKRSPDEFEKGGFAAQAQAWSFVRFMLEDPLPRDARLMTKLYKTLEPKSGAKDNGKLAYEFFVEDEWGSIEKAWKLYLVKLSETPADKFYREAREAVFKRDYAKGHTLLDACVKADPDYERIYYYRALCSFYTDGADAAAPDLDQALAIFPEYTAARFLRGRVRAAKGDATGAKLDFEACLETPYREQAKRQLEALK
ncbi:MAG: hypothetical protein KIS92_25795 [Planctomycetota bacterium]|nr:hypothetical protein [Planctomycetota bacterium]